MTYSAKVIAGGKIVIPAALRRELGLKEGDRLVVQREGGTLVLKPFSEVLRELRERVRKYVPEGVSLADELVVERRAEAAKEEEELQRWIAQRT